MRNRRREFSTEVQRQALARSRGICERHLIPHVFATPCGLPLGDGNTFYEHIVCDGIGGDNTLSNAAVLTKTCWKIKTSTYDLPTVAKTKRMGDGANGIRNPSKKRLPGGRDDFRKHKINGGVVDRRTGERL